MRIPVTSVQSVGVAVRAVRKASGIRQDDVAGVSHVFLRDLEKGKDTVQLGRVLKVLDELGSHMVLEVAPSQASAVTTAMAHLVPQPNRALIRSGVENTPPIKKEGA